MKRTLIKDALQSPVPMDEILVKGWVRTKRDSKDFSFIELNDGSSLKSIQIIVDQTSPAYAEIRKAVTGASLEVTGRLTPSPGKGQKWEVGAATMKVVGEADQDSYPLQKKRHSDEFLRTIAHLRPRTNKLGAIFRIRSEASFAVHQYFRSRGYFYIHTPIITGSDCEGAGSMFRVTTLDPARGKPGSSQDDFFGQDAYLTVSGQLSAEIFASSLGQVYTFGPTFRAENSNTARHAAEFWMIEPEVAFADLNDNMDLAEDFIKSLIDHVRENCPDDLELFARFVDKNLTASLDNIVNNDFVRVPHAEAVDILLKAKQDFQYQVGPELELQTEHERHLTEHVFKKPVIVYDYPKSVKPFYMRVNDDGRTVGAMDVLLPRVGEIIGGSQREERYQVLVDRIRELGMDEADYWWYLELRRYGTVPHSGFGLGFERFLMMVTGTSNIRDVIPFPRTPASLDF